MWRDFLNRDERPNPFTRAMGERIRQAREQRGLSQEELADVIHRRRPSISEMEHGKMEPDASTLVMLAAALKKPLTYFFPPSISTRYAPAADTRLEEELIMEFRRLDGEPLKLVAVQQVRALADMSTPKDR